MNVVAPRYHLTRLCPVTGQGDTLLLVTCPACGHVAVASCELPGTAFPDPSKVSPDGELSDGNPRPACGRIPLSDFRLATWDEATGVGLRYPDDFR